MSGTPRTGARTNVCQEDLSPNQPTTSIPSPSRRKFLGKLGAATVAAGVIGSAPKALAGLNPVNRIGPNLTVQQSNRVQAAFNLRAKQNVADALLQFRRIPPTVTNGSIPTSPPATAKVCCRTNRRGQSGGVGLIQEGAEQPTANRLERHHHRWHPHPERPARLLRFRSGGPGFLAVR